MSLKFLALLVPFLLFTSCTSLKPGCIVQDKIAAVATDFLVTQLECSNSFAVKVDVDKKVSALGLCKQQTGDIANMMCPLVAGEIVEGVAGVVVPAGWGCKATKAKDVLKSGLEAVCKQIPVSQWQPPQE